MKWTELWAVECTPDAPCEACSRPEAITEAFLRGATDYQRRAEQ